MTAVTSSTPTRPRRGEVDIAEVPGGNWPGDPDPDEAFAPQQMQVDWVRVYQLDPV